MKIRNPIAGAAEASNRRPPAASESAAIETSSATQSSWWNIHPPAKTRVALARTRTAKPTTGQGALTPSVPGLAGAVKQVNAK